MSFFLVGHFDFFFQKEKFFLVFSNENNLGFHARYHFFENFDDYPGFQPFRSWANTYAQDCSKQPFIRKPKYICSKNSYRSCYLGSSKEFRESRWLWSSFEISVKISSVVYFQPDEIYVSIPNKVLSWPSKGTNLWTLCFCLPSKIQHQFFLYQVIKVLINSIYSP